MTELARFRSAMRTEAGLLLPIALALSACDDNTGAEPVDYAAFLRATTETVLLPAHATFAARADELAAATATLERTPDAGSLGNAQAAWRSARAAFRALDSAHFGPIADRGTAGRIDLSPASPADIEAIIADTAPIDGSLEAASGKTKGFLGLEYLLFSREGTDAVVARLRGDGAAETRRRALARAMGADIAAAAHELDDAWSPTKGGYANEVTTAGRGSKRYASQRAVVDDLVGGVGYGLEVVVGVRLALVLGRRSGGVPDPSKDYTVASDNSVADMTATINGVRALYEGAGFSSRIRVKSAALDARILTELEACSAKIGAIPPPLVETVTKDVASVQAAFDACKDLKATWNTDATSALGATLKPADNDGD